MNELKNRSKQFSQKLAKIKVFLIDVDGVLTDGRIFYSGEELGFNRFFHTHDGYILKVLRSFGIKTGVISGGNSIGLKKRLELLHLDYIYLGNEDKRKAYIDIRDKGPYRDEEMLYIGDEIFDIPILRRVGFAATVPEACFEVKDNVNYVTDKGGGKGAVREVADLLRYARNFVIDIQDVADLEK